jgi:hypothetical protein
LRRQFTLAFPVLAEPLCAAVDFSGGPANFTGFLLFLFQSIETRKVEITSEAPSMRSSRNLVRADCASDDFPGGAVFIENLQKEWRHFFLK